MTKVFIDGSQGTTGLKIFDRLSKRTDIELRVLTGDDRKDPAARKKALNEADIAFLCLPDAAATEAVEWVENDHTVILDTSTAHRTSPGWAYGFPELSEAAFEKVKNGKRIAVPGCHASGFIALVEPLVQNGFIKPETYLSCTSLTGYSGGGKKMIAQYETETDNPLLKAPRVYGLSQQHKHLKEMVAVTGLKTAPAFCPIVAPFYSGICKTAKQRKTSRRFIVRFIISRLYLTRTRPTKRVSFLRRSCPRSTVWKFPCSVTASAFCLPRATTTSAKELPARRWNV